MAKWIEGVGGKALTAQQWDDLFDGDLHQIDLTNHICSVSSFRSAVYREAEKRNGFAKTHRLSDLIIEVRTYNGAPLKRLAPQQPATSPDPWSFTHTQEPPPTPTIPAEELDDEALLGPCTCGQSPRCLPDCARFA